MILEDEIRKCLDAWEGSGWEELEALRSRAREGSGDDDARRIECLACWIAAGTGSLECLEYLREREYEWDEETCRTAALKGHLECLRYAHEHGCPWDEGTCKWAALGGRLECLRYAHEHGCPWDEDETGGGKN